MMKRGLVAWDREEVPPETVERRKEEVLAWLQAEQIDVLLVYGDVFQSDDLHYLTNFNPYWMNAMAVLTAEGDLFVLTSLSARVKNWIASTSWVNPERILPAAGQLGWKAADIVETMGSGKKCIGLAGPYMPHTVYQQLRQRLPWAEITDVSMRFRRLRRRADEVMLRLTERAAQIASGCLALVVERVVSRDTLPLGLAAAERYARYEGAQDVVIHADCTMADAEKDLLLLEVMVQYKGCWAVAGRTVSLERAGREVKEEELQVRETYRELLGVLRPGLSEKDLQQMVVPYTRRGDKLTCGISSPVGPDYRSLHTWKPQASEVIENGSLMAITLTVETTKGRTWFFSDTCHCCGQGARVLTFGFRM